MATTLIAPGLYVWTITLDTGEVRRQVLASSLQSAIGHLPVVAAQRGAPVDAVRPAPVLASLVPDTAALGDPSFQLQVLGTGFQPSDLILWNGAPEPTEYVSPTELTTAVDMSTAAAALPIPVAVRTAIGEVSNALVFTLTAAGSAEDR